jgi:SAM-dependent MidA family methyltransferase
MEQAFYGMFAFNLIGGLASRRLLDFLTSPEVGPLFREFVENVIDENWIDLARPEKAVFCY